MNCDAGQSGGFISKGCREFEMTIYVMRLTSTVHDTQRCLGASEPLPDRQV